MKKTTSGKSSFLAETLNSTFLDDISNMWTVSGQHVFNNMSTEYPDAITFVAKTPLEDSLYSVGVIVGNKNYFKEKHYTKAELRKNFPILFKLKGKSESYHVD